jgi:Uma2 family endonuclease
VTAVLENPAVRSVVLPISVEQYHALSEAGKIPEKTELLRGVIIEKMTKSPLHTWTVGQLVDWFEARVDPQAHVRKEEPLTLDVSEPEPDVAVVDGNRDDYQTAHPRTARLVIEVAVSSEDLDREKGEDYAGAGVSEYWIVLPEKDTIEVFRDPSPTGYASHQRFTFGDSIPLVALGPLVFPVDQIRKSVAE